MPLMLTTNWTRTTLTKLKKLDSAIDMLQKFVLTHTHQTESCLDYQDHKAETRLAKRVNHEVPCWCLLWVDGCQTVQTLGM